MNQASVPHPYRVSTFAHVFYLQKETTTPGFYRTVHTLLAQSVAGAEREAIIYIKENKLV